MCKKIQRQVKNLELDKLTPNSIKESTFMHRVKFNEQSDTHLEADVKWLELCGWRGGNHSDFLLFLNTAKSRILNHLMQY